MIGRSRRGCQRGSPLEGGGGGRQRGRSSPTLALAVFLSLGIVLVVAYRFGSTGVKGSPSPVETREVRVEKDQMMVYVVGAVHKPGVYTLPSGCRAVDAIKAAGGLTDKANNFGVNLAAKLHDEQMLRVPAIGEKIPDEVAGPPKEGEATFTPSPDDGPAPDLTPASPVESAPPGPEPEPEPSSTPHKKKKAGPASPDPSATPGPIPDISRVSLNRATLKELKSVPGMDADMAASIVDYRAGPPPHAFTSIDDLEVVTGLKGKDLHTILRYLKL